MNEWLLPIRYYHAVFTLDHRLSPLIHVNQRELYDLLFKSAKRALIELAKDPVDGIGAQIALGRDKRRHPPFARPTNRDKHPTNGQTGTFTDPRARFDKSPIGRFGLSASHLALPRSIDILIAIPDLTPALVLITRIAGPTTLFRSLHKWLGGYLLHLSGDYEGGMPSTILVVPAGTLEPDRWSSFRGYSDEKGKPCLEHAAKEGDTVGDSLPGTWPPESNGARLR
jgi:hypothetical protein